MNILKKSKVYLLCVVLLLCSQLSFANDVESYGPNTDSVVKNWLYLLKNGCKPVDCYDKYTKQSTDDKFDCIKCQAGPLATQMEECIAFGMFADDCAKYLSTASNEIKQLNKNLKKEKRKNFFYKVSAWVLGGLALTFGIGFFVK